MIRVQHVLRTIFAVVMVSGLGDLAAHGSLIYTHDSERQLGTLETTTGAFTSIGRLPLVMFDIAFSPDGRLYGIGGYYLWEINPQDASARRVGDVGFFINALTFRSDGALFATGISSLIRIDPETGAGSYVGHFEPYTSAGDLEFDAAGRLFVTTLSNELVQLDVSNGQPTAVGPMGFTDVYGMAFVDGTMYGVSDRQKAVFSINLETGEGTLLARFAAPLAGALGATVGSPVPEPSAISVLALIACGGLLSRRRR